MVALVGTRGALRESTLAAHDLAGELSRAGLVVVSGGAIGVDAGAHSGALEAGGRTVAVLGSGLKRLYPARNEALFARIARAGAVISPYPDDAPPRRGHFPHRNRIVAALARAVVVVEAPRRSGALNTASHARALEVPVLAMPRGEGALQLLRTGAGLVTEASDVLRVLEGDPLRSFLELPGDADEQAVLELLHEAARGLTLDLAARQLGWRVPRTAAALLRLEIAGWVRSGAGGRFVRTA